MGDKKICITGTAIAGQHPDGPKRLLQLGFQRPDWYTVGGSRLTDAYQRWLTIGQLLLAIRDGLVLADYTSSLFGRVGILHEDYDFARKSADEGVVVMGPWEICAQIAEKHSDAKVFAILSPHAHVPKKLEESAKANLVIIQPSFTNSFSWKSVTGQIEKML